MIRPITPADSAAVVALAISSGLFPSDASGFLDKMMADYFASNHADGHMCLLDEDAEAVGVAYYQPVLATDRTWSLTMIAVRTGRQGQGRGAALLRHVEDELRRSGQRMLLVETSGTPEFVPTRAFYAKCGYDEEARVRDYFAAGEEMVLFRKVFSAS